MIVRKTINKTTWVQITSAGQSGSVWVDKNNRGSGVLLLNHSDNGIPTARYGFRLSEQNGNIDYCEFIADNDNDIMYARVTKSGDEIMILVDAS